MMRRTTISMCLIQPKSLIASRATSTQAVPRRNERKFQKASPTISGTDLFKQNFDFIPQIAYLCTKMEVKHKPLIIIVPQFETPLLGLATEVFPPVLKELPNPSLCNSSIWTMNSRKKIAVWRS